MNYSLILFILLSFFPIFAQAAPQQERIQAEQQRLLDEQFRQQDLQRTLKKPISSDIQKPNEFFEESTSKGCVTVSSVIFSGNLKIRSQRLNQIAKKYLNRCLTLPEIDQLLKDITNVYLIKGYITSKAFLVMPQPRLKEGVLEIKIVEGNVQNIEGLPAGQRKTAFPFITGGILNLRDIEQGLEQINRLPSQNASMEILPSDQSGYSIIRIKNQESKTTALHFMTDNAGARSTGNHRTGGKLTQDNLFGINDQFNINYMKAPSKNKKRRDANYATASYTVPFGYWTAANHFSYSDYRTNMTLSTGIPLYSLGSSMTNSTHLERLLARGQNFKLSANAGITYKNNKNYTEVLDLKIKNTVSSRHLTVLHFGVSGTLFWNGGVLYLNPSYVQGMRWFHALNDRETTFRQKAQYRAGKLYGYLSQTLGAGFSLNITADGQYSKNELFSSEGFYLGGEYSVRGFKNDGIQGDSGIVFRNDLNWHYKGLTLGSFFDWGTVQSNTPQTDRAVLSGAGTKAALSIKNIVLSASYAKPQHRSAGMMELESKAWYLSAQASLQF
ncbi:MAG: ShlB/FhaC/HecB family hemolysin secretion/activation protein [Alphaproteobacteria bacterium]|nr:ShlB/FhaC/HecB family hemolysin secretion/activation protein [Alphaproteobacteria bacterium]